jgi:ketosteroid isomerase-like protein
VSDPRETGIREAFEAFNRGDVETVLEILHPDVEVYNSPEVGEEGSYRGHDGYLAWLRVWLEAWDEFRIDIDEVEVLDERTLLVHCSQHGRGKGSGVEVTRRVVFLNRVEDGLTTQVHIYGDRESAIAAAGGS